MSRMGTYCIQFTFGVTVHYYTVRASQGSADWPYLRRRVTGERITQARQPESLALALGKVS